MKTTFTHTIKFIALLIVLAGCFTKHQLKNIHNSTLCYMQCMRIVFRLKKVSNAEWIHRKKGKRLIKKSKHT